MDSTASTPPPPPAPPLDQLVAACREGDVIQVRNLLLQFEQMDADTSALDLVGVDSNTLLITATRHGHDELVTMLLMIGANVDAVGVNGATALHNAAQEGHLKCVALLLGSRTADSRSDASGSLVAQAGVAQTGAQLNITDTQGDMPLLAAARSGHFEVVKLLLSAGASVHAGAADGETVLVSAARWLDLSIVSLLFTLGHLTPTSTGDGDREALLLATLQTLHNYRVNTHEFQHMWTRLLDRMLAIYSRLAASPDMHRDSVHQFMMVAFNLIQLKPLCSMGSLCARLVASDDIVARLSDFHTELTHLEHALSLAMPSDAQPHSESDELELLALF